MTLRLHISDHNDDLHNTTAKRNAAGGLAGLDASGNVEDISGNNCITDNKINVADGIAGLNTSILIEKEFLELPIMKNSIWLNGTSTGTAYRPTGINDNDVEMATVYENVNEYVEVNFGNLYFMKKWRQYGTPLNNGSGEYKLQYWNGSNWVDLVTFSTKNISEWSSWIEFSEIISTTKIKLIGTILDNEYNRNYLKEFELSI